MKSKLPIQFGVGVLIILLYFGVVVYTKRTAEIDEEVVNNANTNDVVQSNDNNTSDYKNGIYSATGSYSSPGGNESLVVTLTLANGKIVNSTIVLESGNPTSKLFKEEFVDNYKQFVIGKDIADLKLTKVAGSSITPIGFNDAVEQIKAQAS